MLSKEVVGRIAKKVRWTRLLQNNRASGFQHSSSMSQESKLQRYTNFTLDDGFEHYHFLSQHLLLREAVFPTMAANPQLLDVIISDLPGSEYQHKSLTGSKLPNEGHS